MRKTKNLLKKVTAGFLAVTLVAGSTSVGVNAEEAVEGIVSENAVTITKAAAKEEVAAAAEETAVDTTAETTDENGEETTDETGSAGSVQEVVLTVGATENDVNVTWFTMTESSLLQIAAADETLEDGEFPENYTEYTAVTKVSDIEGYYSNSVSLTGLAAGNYVYRVGNEGAWSAVYNYEVKNTAEGYEFLVVGDPQIGSSDTDTDAANWAATMQLAASTFDNAGFLLSVGDQINSARNDNAKAESNFIGFLGETAGLASLPLASSVGNHDNSHASLYTAHFTLPNVSEYGNTDDAVTGEEDYYFTYGNTLYMMINTNNSSIAEHKAFIEETLAANPDCTWNVAAFHQSIYSVAKHVNDGNIADLRVGLSPIFAENNIDVVLMGHDHVYARSYIMGGVTGMQADIETNEDGTALTTITDPNGVQYITFNSGSGSKYYDVTSELYEYTAVQNQEKSPNYSHVTVTADSFEVTTYRTTDNSVVDTVKLVKTENNTGNVLTDTVKTAGTTQTVTAEIKTEGYENETAELAAEKTAEYDSGVVNADGGSAEIVQYNSDTQMYYVVNGTTGTLDIVPREVYEANGATGVKCDLKAELAELRPDFEYGDMTSVAVNIEKDLIAVAVQAAGTADEGFIVLMNYDNEVVAVIGAGVQPDMVTFAEDGTKVLSANEGEPRDGYAAETEETEEAAEGAPGGQPGGPGMGGNTSQGPVDPEGTVTIADLSAGLSNITSKNVTFEAYDSEEARAALVEAGVILKKGSDPSADLEPEYIAVNGNTAYVALQEANAVAVIDIENGAVTAINSLGFKDHNLEENALDLAKDDTINIKTENVYGIYMPDGISVYEANGKTYLVTANEGDAREWGSEEDGTFHLNEAETTEINGEDVVIFDQTEYEGLDTDKTYIFGGRSFSVYEMNTDGTMTQVYDSGKDFEEITAKVLADYFNCSNDKISMDNRSGKKGPEAESVVVGEVNGETYAFIGLERIGGVMIYNITDPANAHYVNYINSRDFSAKIAGDVSPEGLCFVPASESLSQNAELIVAHEVSGTVAVYEMTANEAADEEEVPGDNDQDEEETPGDDDQDQEETPGDDDSQGNDNHNKPVVTFEKLVIAWKTIVKKAMSWFGRWF